MHFGPILCVEDHEPTRGVLAAALRDYTPDFAATGREAAVKINLANFDAYVIDLWLPDYSGTSVCRDIRRADPNVPIVFWTVADEAHHRDKAMGAGASAYLVKSPEYELLQEHLADLIGDVESRRAHAERAAEDIFVAAVDQFTAYCESNNLPAIGGERFNRLVKRRVRNAFVQAGGTLVQFDRWWASRTH